MLRVRHQEQAVGRAPAGRSRDHERAHCCSPRLQTSLPSAPRGAGPCSLTLGINVPFPKGLRPGLLPHFPPQVLYSSFSGLNQKVLLSSAVFWCLAPKSSFHRKFCSLGSPASLWAPYSVFSGQHTSSSRYCILLPASSCGAQNHHSTSLQEHLRARRTCRIPRPGSHAVAEHTDCPSHPSPLSRLLS